MKRTQSFSLYAFIIAFLVHLLIALSIVLFLQVRDTLIPPEPEKPQEQRFKLSLKEMPERAQEAPVRNDLPIPPKTLPIPRGEQMKKPSQPLLAKRPEPQKPAHPSPVQTPTPPASSAPQPAPSRSEPLPEVRRAFERHVAVPVATIERTAPKKSAGLYDILSKADPSANDVRSRGTTKISDSIERLYGDKFNELSEGEQKYIVDNQEIMRRITQAVLDRYGRSKIPDSVRIDDTNMIEFYLHPDGSISDLHFLKNSQLSILDDTTKETIELAYAQYPRPQQKTLIRYRVWYNLSGH